MSPFNLKKRTMESRFHTDLPCDGCDKSTAGKGNDYYMVTNTVWCVEANLPSSNCMLCRNCLSIRLGRPLVREDYTNAPVNWNILISEFGETIESICKKRDDAALASLGLTGSV
jgi:hypothetical protein